MIWGLLTVIVIGLLILFAAPYLSFLAPGDHIWLVDTTIKEDPVLLAIGSETLWIQWQSWVYIFLFSLITAFILGLIYNGIRTFSDESLLEAKQELAKKKKELENIKREYQAQVEQDVVNKHAKEAKQLNKKENEIYAIKQQTENKEVALQNQIRMVNHAHRRQNQQTQSKLGQRDRLSAEKKIMAEFLDEMDWKFTDGTKITYNALARLAKKHRGH
jgi:Tfp pilus assembly protein PilO